MWRYFFRAPFVPMTLPESYTNLFTWEEQLRRLIKDVYDFVDFFNDELGKLDSDVDFKINQAVNSSKAGLQSQINEIKNHADQIYNQLNAEMTALRRDVSNTATTLRAEMANLRNSLLLLFDDLDTSVDSRIRQVYQKIEDTKNSLLVDISNALLEAKRYTDLKVDQEKLERELEDARLERLIANLQFKLPNIYNPSKGLLGSIGQAVCDLYNYLAFGGLKIKHTIDDDISVDYFEDNPISVEYIDTKMGYDLDTSKALSMWSPYSGKKDRLDNIIYEMARQINVNNKKIDIFADNDISVDDMDGSDYNAWEMGTRHWVDNSAPKGYEDINRLDYTLVFEDKVTSQQAFELVVKSYDYYMIEVLFYSTGATTKTYMVKNNTRFDLSDYQLVNDTSIRDLALQCYRYGEVQKYNSQTQFRFEGGYRVVGSTHVQVDDVVIARIWGVNKYNDTTTKED